ncbi:glycoside hydrolase family 31 protein [Amycolatopsis sp. cg5]|uniref:glycoside hydrolase family 31 protein n=1 Tax=Amycolatopsis sp. cg5 TaxID=3238802 RepID=UPI003525C382
MRLHRTLVAGLVALLVAGGLTATTSAAAPDAAHGDFAWTATKAPFQLNFTQHHKPLIGQAPGSATGPGNRLSYLLADGTTHRATDLLATQRIPGGSRYQVATDEATRTAQVDVTRTPRGLRVAWTLTPDTGVTQVYEALTGNTSEHFLGGGASSLFVDLKGKVVFNKAMFTGASTLGKCNQSGAASPFFLSSQGYGVYLDTTATGRIAFPGAAEPFLTCDTNPPLCPVTLGVPDRTQFCFKDNKLAYEIYAGNPEHVSAQYFAKVGLPVLPPARQFASIKWRDKILSQNEVIEDMVELQKAGIPLDTIWIDNPWEQGPEGTPVGTACIGALKFDSRQFPDPQGMIDTLHAHGVHLGVWVAPFLAKTAGGQPCPHDYPEGSFVVSDKNTWDIDLTNPVARAHYQAKLESVFRMGVDFVKGDRGDENDLELSTFQGGPGTLVHNRYPQLYAETVANALRNVHGDDYTMLFRSGYPGMSTVLRGFWQADADMSFDGLRLTTRRAINSWGAGHPVQGSDTGGYRKVASDSPSPTLFTRWAQLSAVSPVFEVGGPGRNATPWVYDPATVDRFRKSTILHYELFPYLYEEAKRASRTGTPINRPMGFQYPGDEEAWKADQQFMIGSDLLAAPVTADRAEADGAAGLPTPVDVYLPPGQWIDLYAGKVVEGGRHVVRESTLDDFPLYLRAGSAVAFNFRSPELFEKAWGLNDLDRKDRAGWLVSPDASACVDSPSGGKLTTWRFGRTLTMTVTGAPAETELLIPSVPAGARVLIDGRPADQSTVEQLRAKPTGWTMATGEFPGLAVKLRPRHGFSTVTVYQ